MSTKIWPHVQQKLAFRGHSIFFFYHFSIFISIDSEWSKMYDFERKIQNKTKSLKIHISFLSGHSASLSLYKKNIFVADRRLNRDPLPPFAAMSIIDFLRRLPISPPKYCSRCPWLLARCRQTRQWRPSRRCFRESSLATRRYSTDPPESKNCIS